MTILLDIDGVLVTTPSWRPSEIMTDGFMKFNDNAASNLQKIISATGASITLTSTHRISYDLETWRNIFKQRGILASSISKINDKASLSEMAGRATEIKEWVNTHGDKNKFVIIDDDLSINSLPSQIKDKCVLTKSLIGLDEEATSKALEILNAVNLSSGTSL